MTTSDAGRAMVRVTNVTKTFARIQGQALLRDRLMGVFRRGPHRFPALQNISFAVQPGESLGLIGHNGAGKSTLLALVAGLAKPDSGTIEVRGRIAPLLELGAGFHPDLSGRENARLNASLLGLSRKETEERLPEMVEFSGIGDFIEAPIRTYSAGMVMRLAFSVAASVQPEIVLIDEVLAVGDQEFVLRCYSRLRRFREEGVTVLVVSHSMDSILDLCDTALWTDSGRVRMHGTAREVVDAYTRSTRHAE